jgi:hypothetical protein
VRVPGYNDLETIKKQLELQQLGDKPDKRWSQSSQEAVPGTALEVQAMLKKLSALKGVLAAWR